MQHIITNSDFQTFKVLLTQQLKTADHQQLHVFADWVLENHENYSKFQRKIISSDEAHCHFVNKQNCRNSGCEKP